MQKCSFHRSRHKGIWWSQGVAALINFGSRWSQGVAALINFGSRWSQGVAALINFGSRWMGGRLHALAILT